MQKYLPFLILWVLSKALTIESTTSLNESSVPKSLLRSGWGRHGDYSEDENDEDESDDENEDDNMDNEDDNIDDDTNTLTSETSQNMASLQSPSILLLIALSALV